MTENTEGNALGAGRAALDAEQQGRINRFALCVPIGVAVYSLSALFWFHLRRDTIEVRSSLQALYASIYGWFGFSACIVFFLLLLVWTSIWFFAGRVDRPIARLLRLASVAVMLGVFLSLGKTAADGPTQGELGFYLAQRLVAAIGSPASWLVVFVGTIASLFLATDFFFSDAFERAFGKQASRESAIASERGVEVAVTEHLKGLSQVAPVRPPAPSVGAVEKAATLAAAAEADDAEVDGEARVHGESDAPDTVLRPAPAAEPTRYARRRSYFERRHEEVAPETWVAKPEPQEIDNPESELADGAAAGGLESESGAVSGSVPPNAEASASTPAMDADAVARADEPFAIVEGDEVGVEADAVDEAGDEPITRTVDAARAEDSAVDEVEDETDESGAMPAFGVAADDADEADEVEDAEPEDLDEADEAQATSPDAAGLPLFAIPRPEPESEPAAELAPREDATAGVSDGVVRTGAEAQTRQRGLFGPAFDEDLLAEAKQIVLESNRPTAALLRRRLRIGYQEACEVLAELSARGLVDWSGEA